jgi:cobalt-zinc-cadmium efflux system outer membrane protein
MSNNRGCRPILLGLTWALTVSISTWAQTPVPSPPLSLADAMRLAAQQRDEIEAARHRARAGEARPAIVSALDDPMIAPSLDHLPFGLDGANVSVTVEQRFPLSGLRRHRRAAAMADVARLHAETRRTSLDVEAQAVSAFLMLQERRRTAALVAEQLTFAQDVVTAANARYASGSGPQSDVLRAEVEVARLEAAARGLVAEVRGAEAMLNAALAMDPARPVPPLVPLRMADPVPEWAAVLAVLEDRPELHAGRAAIARSEADVQVMRDMFRPMMTIRTGPASNMLMGRGWMAMAGVSVPLRRGRLRAGVAEAEAMRAMSQAELRAMTRMVEGEAAVALRQLEAARDRRAAVATDVLPRARMAIEPAVAGYSAGQLPLVSVIEAVQALWLVQSELIATETELGLAWARLARAMGSFEGMPR